MSRQSEEAPKLPEIDPNIFRYAAEQAYDSVLITDARMEFPGPTIIYANRAFCQKTGYSMAELVGQSPRILQGPRTDRAVLDRLKDCISKGERFEGQAINYRKDGSTYVVRWNISPVLDAQGVITHFVSLQRDISHESELENFNRQLLSSLAEGVVGIDAHGLISFANPAALRMLGYAQEQELMGRDAHKLFHHSYPDGRPIHVHDCPIYRSITSGEPLHNWRDHFWNRQQQSFPVEVSVAPLRQDLSTVLGGVFVFRDISHHVRMEQELEYAANFDPLTGAYNRRMGEQLMAQQWARLQRYQEPTSLLMLDIDHFKQINDRFGHAAGDQVLQQLVSTLEQHKRALDSLIRWGGEEFLLLLPNTTLNGAEIVAEQLRQKVAALVFDLENPLQVTISIGVGCAQWGESIDHFLRRVDAALYRAKDGGRNRVQRSEEA